MGSFRPAAGGGAAKILRKAPTVQNGADSRSVHLKRGRKRRDVRCQIDNRPGAFRPRFGQPSKCRPMPGANESSTVEWPRAHGMPGDLLRPVPPGAGSKKPVTPATGLSLSRARARKKRNRARFMIGWLLLLVCGLRSRGCPEFLFALRPRKIRGRRSRFGNYRRVSPNANGRDPRSVAELAFGEASSLEWWRRVLRTGFPEDFLRRAILGSSGP